VSPINLADVMDELGDRLATISGLRVHRWPPDSITPPAAIVSYPDSYEFDSTYGRGMDRVEIPVIVVVGKVSDRAARTRLSRYVAGSGPASVKYVLERAGEPAQPYTAIDSLRVTRVDFDVVTIAGTDYLAATFTVDIAAKGAVS